MFFEKNFFDFSGWIYGLGFLKDWKPHNSKIFPLTQKFAMVSQLFPSTPRLLCDNSAADVDFWAANFDLG